MGSGTAKVFFSGAVMDCIYMVIYNKNKIHIIFVQYLFILL